MNSKIIFLFLISAILVAGCTSSGSGNTAKLEKDLYKGTKGVLLTFFEVPKEVFENEELTYSVKIENKGPYPVTNLALLVSLEKGYAQFKDNGQNWIIKKGDLLDGKTIYNTFDDFEILSLPIQIKSLDGQSETHDTFISTTMCYDYQGMVFADVCIDTDPHGMTPGNQACTIKSTISLSEGQGGPVVISKIDTKMLLDDEVIRPQFKIGIVNQGKGTVYQPGAGNIVCSDEPLSRNTYNAIRLAEVEISGRKLSSGQIECIPSDLVLRKEEDVMTCTVKKENGIPRTTPSYLTPLQVRLDYGYTESVSKEISINKILKY